MKSPAYSKHLHFLYRSSIFHETERRHITRHFPIQLANYQTEEKKRRTGLDRRQNLINRSHRKRNEALEISLRELPRILVKGRERLHSLASGRKDNKMKRYEKKKEQKKVIKKHAVVRKSREAENESFGTQ